MADDAVGIELSELERAVLRAGMLEWGGSARPTEVLARALGFAGLAELGTETERLSVALLNKESLTPTDWRRVLLATEIAFASDVVGSGVEWPITTGISDLETFQVLRGLQRRLPR